VVWYYFEPEQEKNEVSLASFPHFFPVCVLREKRGERRIDFLKKRKREPTHLHEERASWMLSLASRVHTDSMKNADGRKCDVVDNVGR